MTKMTFDYIAYWNKRISAHLHDFDGVCEMGRSLPWSQVFCKSRCRAIERALRKIQPNLSTVRMLDVGTGIGLWVDYFLSKGVKSITGIDIVPSAIELLRNKYSEIENCDFCVADITDDDFPERIRGTFNLVTAIDMLYHIIEDEKFNNAIKNMASVLQLGGHLFLTDTLFFSREELPPKEHVHFRGLARYMRQLEENGLNVVYLSPVFTFLHRPIGGTSIFTRLFNLFYCQSTLRLTQRETFAPELIQKIYLNILYNLDSVMTLFPRFGISIKLLVARKSL